MTSEMRSPKRPRICKVDVPEQLHSCEGIVSVCFDHSYPGPDIKLFELSSKIMGKVKVGEKLKIIGPIKGDAVLCSNNATFSIKKVETSNNVFLVPPSNSKQFNIVSKSNQYFELLPIRGKTESIVELLRSTTYEGKNMNDSSENQFTRSQLESMISASSHEIEEALKKLHVVEVGTEKKLRMLSKTILYETTRLILDTIIENDWKLSDIDEIALKTKLPEADEVFLNHILGSLGKPLCSGKWCLSENLVAKSTADMLFRFRPDNTKLWPSDDFITVWSSRTPGSISPSEDLLSGIAIKEEIPQKNGISVPHYRYLPVDELPLDLKARFAHLFMKRQKYSVSELKPYLEGFYGGIGQPSSIAELALQHSRFIDNYYQYK